MLLWFRLVQWLLHQWRGVFGTHGLDDVDQWRIHHQRRATLRSVDVCWEWSVVVTSYSDGQWYVERCRRYWWSRVCCCRWFIVVMLMMIVDWHGRVDWIRGGVVDPCGGRWRLLLLYYTVGCDWRGGESTQQGWRLCQQQLPQHTQHPAAGQHLAPDRDIHGRRQHRRQSQRHAGGSQQSVRVLQCEQREHRGVRRRTSRRFLLGAGRSAGEWLGLVHLEPTAAAQLTRRHVSFVAVASCIWCWAMYDWSCGVWSSFVVLWLNIVVLYCM